MEHAAFSLFLFMFMQVERMCLSNMFQECTMVVIQVSTILGRESLSLDPFTNASPHFTS